MQLTSNEVVVFTDGASRGNPGPGGWAAIVVKHDDSQTNADFTQTDAEARHIQVVELGGKEEHTTNNRMELTAAIEVLKGLTLHQEKGQTLKAIIYSDSAYLLNGMTKWIHGWQKNGWRTAGKKDVENRDLWMQLADLTQNYADRTQKSIEWKHIGGHVGVAGNHRADEIATAFADNKEIELYSGPIEQYPIKDILDLKMDVGLASQKESNKTRSRAKAYSYVSLVDGAVQTHKTWKECEARVKGKSGAKYQKVFSAEAERSLVRAWGRMK